MLSRALCLLACLCLSCVAFADEGTLPLSFEPFTGKITGSKVRIRTQPKLDAPVLRETKSGEMCAVVGEQEGFFAIRPPTGTKGYVFRTFVLDGVVEGDRVNVRLYPDMDAPVIAQLNTGDKIHFVVSDTNNKWLEIDLPDTALFYLAKEYCEKAGPVELLAQVQARIAEASHHFSAVCLYAQAEMQKSVTQIDFDSIATRFSQVSGHYSDLPEIAQKAQEASRLLHDIYIQKKLAFLEGKNDPLKQKVEIATAQLEQLAALGIHLNATDKDMSVIAEAASQTMGLASPLADQTITDKMLTWQPLEEAIYHLWAATHGDGSLEEFYQEERSNAIVLSGMLETYNRPVKNLPGDYVLRSENHPVAFLYSTRINLGQLVGKNVTLIATPRPNNNFAFPAYFVLAVE